MNNKGKIGLGSVQFGTSYGISNKNGKTPALEVTKILKSAVANKIDVLDSASAYGNAEKVLGNNNLKRFKVISKFLPSSLSKTVETQFEESLKNLGVSSLYGYLAHRPLELLLFPENWNSLLKLKEEGKIKKIGFSLNEPKDIQLLEQKGFIPDIVQAPFNYFDDRFKNIFIELKEKDCEVHSRSTFLQGLFFLDPNYMDPFFDEVKIHLRSLQTENKSFSGSLLKYVVDKPFIDKVIIGVENEYQLLHNLRNLENASDLKNLGKEVSPEILNPSLWPKN